MEEATLISRLKEGDEAAFKTLVEKYQRMVYNTTLNILQNAEDAEDIAQEIFVEVYMSIHQFKGASKLSTWIYRITLTKAWDFIRYKRRKKRFARLLNLFDSEGKQSIDPPDFVHPGIQLENKETASALFKGIHQLSAHQQTAFTLHKLEGLSYQDIAEIMKMNLPAIESLIHRAKKNLQKSLSTFYHQP